MAFLRSSTLIVMAWLMLASGYARPSPTGPTSLNPTTFGELQRQLLSRKADLEVFRSRGPFAVTTHKDHEVRLSTRVRIDTDLYLSAPVDKAPLVIFLHGHDSSKEAHANQAMHLASWGMHCLTVQLSKNGPWVGNGKTLASIARSIHRLPAIIDRRIDVNKIILVGHSFGGAAVAIALAEGAPVAGGILLDPAAGNDLPKFLQQINTPVMLLGADDEVSPALNRDYFYRFIRRGIAEVSIKDAAHEDAQFPSEFALRSSGIDPDTTEELQVTFVSAITSAAVSLSSSGTFEYAWTSFGAALEKGKFFNARKK